MRITNQIMQQGALGHIQGNLSKIADAQRKVSSGLRLQKASDDPTAATSSMRARSSLRSLEQYRRGVETAQSRATTEESILDQVNNALVRAKELAIAGSSSSATDQTRGFARAEVDQIFRHVVGLANTRFGDAFLFGGARADTQPYDVTVVMGNLDFTTTNPTGDHLVEISEQRFLPSTHNGVEAFEDTGALAALRDLSIALGSNNPATIAAGITAVDSAFSGVNDLMGEIGARTNQLDVSGAHLDVMEQNLLTFKSDLEEVEVEEVMSELVGRQTAFQAAMLATSRVMSLSLADYLR
jgi:flagellar hook-associated protein 3 FlgL